MSLSRSPPATPSIPARAPTPASIAGPKPSRVDFACTWDVYWNADTDVIDIQDLPARAFDSPQEYEQTRALIDAYNRTTTLTPQLDAAFRRPCRRAHPRPSLPLLRGTPARAPRDMWLRPRTETLWIELRWWQYNRHNAETEFAVGYAALNLAYLAAALAGFLKRPRLSGVILAFVLLRCALLATLEAPEPRYNPRNASRR